MCDANGCRCSEFKANPFRGMVCGTCTHAKDVHRERMGSVSPLVGSAGAVGGGIARQGTQGQVTRAPAPVPLALAAKLGAAAEFSFPEGGIGGGRKRSQSDLPPMRPVPPIGSKIGASRPQPPPRENEATGGGGAGLKGSGENRPTRGATGGTALLLDNSSLPIQISPITSPLYQRQRVQPQSQTSPATSSPLSTTTVTPTKPQSETGTLARIVKNATLRIHGQHVLPEITQSSSSPTTTASSTPTTTTTTTTTTTASTLLDLLPRSRPRIPNHPPPSRPEGSREGSIISSRPSNGGLASPAPPPLTKRMTSIHALVEWGRLKELKELLANSTSNTSSSGLSVSTGGSTSSSSSKEDGINGGGLSNNSSSPSLSSLILSVDERGQTLLHVASTFGHTTIIDFLIREHEHDPNPVDNEMWTPLHCAANSGHLNVCYQLIRYGTLVHVPVASQSIILHYLVSKIPLKVASPNLLTTPAEPLSDSNSGRVFSFTMGSSAPNSNANKDGAPSSLSAFGNSAAFGPGSNLFTYLRVLTISMSSFSDVGGVQGPKLVNHQNSNKETPLHKFTISWPMKTPDVTFTTDYYCRMFVLRLLLRSGSDPTIRDCNGKTPFDNLGVRGYDVEVDNLSQEFGFKKEAAAPSSIKLGVESGRRSKLLQMSSQSLFSSRKMLRKELASATAKEEAKQIEEGLIAKGKYSFQSQSDSELSFSKNQMMVIMDHTSSGEWWLASIDGVKGWVPSKFIQILHSAQEVSAPLSASSSSSSLLKDSAGSSLGEDTKKNETVELLHVVMRLLDSIEVDEENFPIMEEAKSNLSLAIASAVALEQQASMYWKTKMSTVIRVQSIVRGMLARKRFKDIIRYIKLPKGPSEELMQTERIYLSQLQILLEKFIRPLVAKAIFKSGDELTSMLGAVEIILETNKTLLKKMEEYYQIPLGQRHKKTTLGQVFNEMAPYFKTYNAYVEKYDPTEFRRLRSKIPGLEELCKKFNSEVTPYFIEDYMAKPMQRALRYSLLLREILKSMPEDHVEYPSLAMAVNKWQDLANEWNERRRRVENQHEVVEIQKSVEGLDLTIVAPSRTFVRKGEVTLYASDGPRTVFLYLFNDFLLLANIRSKKKTTTVSYLNACYLQSLALYDLPDLYDLVNGFQIVFRPQKKARYRFYKSYTIVSKEKKEWMSDLLSTMERCKKTEIRESTREGASLMEGAVHLRTFFSWRSRYGVLRDSKLMLYASEKSKLLESIELHSGFCIRGSDEGKLSFTLEEYSPSSTPASVLSASSEKPLATYSLKANSPQDYRKWVSSLKENIQTLSQEFGR